MRVITINTYAGSLLLGAKAAGLDVELSLEDSDFGVDVQRMNFPDLRIVKDIRAWPKMHLDDYAVIAHPPCSAFSKQNNSPTKMGITSAAFKCTENVMMYGMIQKARVIAIESVPGALEGAWEVHQKYADKYQYDVYRLMVNYASWGSPQWRPRFWALFVRQDVSEGITWPLQFMPQSIPLKDVIGDGHVEDGWREDQQIKKQIRMQFRKWDVAGVDPQIVKDTMAGRRGFGMANSLIGEPHEYAKFAPSKFRSSHLRILDPDGYAPVLMNGCSWIWPNLEGEGRPLYVEEYFKIMGFPTDYKMGWSAVQSGKYKMFLSKGVIPQVATWVLENAQFWWMDQKKRAKVSSGYLAKANDITDLRPDKKSSPAEVFDESQPFAWMEQDEEE